MFIKQTKDDFVQRTGGSKAPPKGKNLPETVNNIVWVRQLEAKVRLLLMNPIYHCLPDQVSFFWTFKCFTFYLSSKYHFFSSIDLV